MNAEHLLLVELTNSNLSSQKICSIKEILKNDINWEHFINLSEYHQISSIVYWNIKTHFGNLIPESYLSKLESKYKNTAVRNMFLTDELLSILKEYSANKIVAIPIKGPLIAEQIYENLTVREFIDIDILVYPKDVEKAKDILIQRDYSLEFYLSEKEDIAYRRSSFYLKDQKIHYTLFNKDKGISIELHWLIVATEYSFSPNIDNFWKRSSIFTLEGQEILSLSIEDLLLYLCIHGTKHHWMQLKWICDINELINKNKDLDWNKLSANANQYKCNRMVLLGLKLTNELYHTELPTNLIKKIDSRKDIRRFADEVISNLFVERYSFSFKNLFFLRAMENNVDRIKYLAESYLVPTPKEFVLINLPKSLSFLYYFIRPVRLGLKYLNLYTQKLIGRRI